jgi:peroxiredoxin Q/BCP
MPGQSAPELHLVGPEGRAITLADFSGRSLVLYFYPKDDTPGCTLEARDFSAALDRFRERGAEVLGVSRDTPKSHAAFRTKCDLQVALASDLEGKTCEAYGTWIEKSMYGRKYMGIDRATFIIGTDGTVRAVWRGVKVPGHVEAVLAAL